jgi:hypothetical protein
MKTIGLRLMSLRLVSPRLVSLFGAALLVVALHAVPTAASGQTGSQNAPTAVSTQGNRGNPESEPKGSGERQASARSAKPRPRPQFGASNPRRPRPPAPQRSVAEALNPPSVRPSAPLQSAAVANRASVQNEAIYRALRVRSGSAIRPGTAAGGNSRHRDPNPPVIRGAASSSNRNAAAIDGMQTNLKRSRN